MGFNLKKIKDKTMTSSVNFAGEKLNFEYIPGKLNQDWYDDVSEAQSADDMDSLIACTCRVLTSWDLEGEYEVEVPDESSENGATKMEKREGPIPVDCDIVQRADLPIPLFGLINREIQENSQSGGKAPRRQR